MKKGTKMSTETVKTEKTLKATIEYLDGGLQEKEVEIEIPFVAPANMDELNVRLNGDMSKLLAAGIKYLEQEAIDEATAANVPADAIDKKQALIFAAPWREKSRFARAKKADGTVETRKEQTSKIFAFLASNPMLMESLKEK